MSPDVAGPVSEVLQSGYVGQGHQVDRFEAMLQSALQTPYVATVNSGTSGLQLALHLLRRGPDGKPVLKGAPEAADGDEIISTPVTCTATNWAILADRFKIKWADVDPDTGNLDPEDVRRKLSPSTKAIIAVHWGGFPCDLAALRSVQEDCFDRFGFRPTIIEDCAHAWGSRYADLPLGGHGNLCVYSFQAIKSLTTGDGGCIVLPNQALDTRARLLRWYGLDRTNSKDFRCEQDVAEWGYKFHMNDVNATIGIHNLPHIEPLIEAQRQTAAHYDSALAGVAGVRLLASSDPDRVPKGVRSSYWLYTIRVDRRDDFICRMKERGIGVSRVHDRNDKHTCVQDFQTSLPGTDAFCGDMICIPCGWWVTPEQREYIVETLREGW
ncbi:MAG: DegT/DnrJ/EryC1/StrS family aminotransferase [Cytophagales bacterium]|nr:DegT/DnrJ/EryC1/StrS family aminotransferase [Armatimonadota bacterium]